MLMAPLDRDETLTVVQRTYVLGIKRKKIGIISHLVSLTIFAVHASMAGTLLVSAFRQMQAWAVNLATFWGWIMFCTMLLLFFCRIVECLELAWNIPVKGQPKLRVGTEEFTKAKASLDKRIPEYLSNPLFRVVRTLTAFAFWTAIVGLVMKGFVLLPILMFFALAGVGLSRIMVRTTLEDSLKAVANAEADALMFDRRVAAERN